MTSSIIQEVQDALPLLVTNVEVQDPIVVIGGEDWHLSIVCPWSAVGADGWFLTWESPDLSEVEQRLLGRKLTGVTAFDEELNDPSFAFEGTVVTIRADTDLDPWTLKISELFLIGRTWLTK